MSSGIATVKQIISGDTVVLMGASKEGPPPEKTLRLANLFAPRKSVNNEKEDEAFGFEAREFLRQWLIGKVVEFTVEYLDGSRENGQIRFEGQDVSVAVVRAGLANLRLRPPVGKNIDELKAALFAAKEEKLGIWSSEASKANTVRDIQWIVGDAPAAKSFVNFHKNKMLPAIIEFIRDGGCYRVYLPEQKINAQILVSGIQVDGFKRVEGFSQLQAEPFALSCKQFVEVRLLNRDVQIRIEEADDFGNIFGTILHPNGNIALSLLRHGFAKIQNWGIRLVENPTQYIDMQKEAQQERKGKWKDWKQSTIDAVKEYQARVIEIASGDCVLVCPLNDDDAEEKRLYLASIRCPRMGNRNRSDEPWSFDAKEFVRKKLIGKKVIVVLEYSRDPIVGSAPAPPPSDSSGKMHFVSIYVDKTKPSINEMLITEGLARTLPHRSDEQRAENFEVLLQREKVAVDSKKGVHNTTSAAPSHRVNDLLGPSNVRMAKGFEESLKRLDKIDGIVEHVFNGGRFKIRIDTEHIAISFVLAGIRCPQTARQIPGQPIKPAEDYAEEALQYSRETLMQRGITIKVEMCDRGGNFIGILWYNKECFNIQLADRGYARLNEMGLAPASIRSDLEEAEKSAREKRLGLWASPTAFESKEEPTDVESVAQSLNISIPSCIVSHSNNVDDFYIQELPSSKIEAIQEKIANHVASLGGVQALGEVYSTASPPKVGDFVLSKFSEDDEWYRARVDSIDRQGMKFKVNYIDFGNSDFVGLKEIYRCPSSLNPSTITALARHSSLSCLKPPPEMGAEGADAFDACTAGKTFRCVIEYIEPQTKKSIIQLYSTNNETNGASSSVSINEDLVSRGFAIFNKKATKSDFSEVIKAAELQARKKHVNVWRHGDIDEDSDDDRGFLSLGGRR